MLEPHSCCLAAPISPVLLGSCSSPQVLEKVLDPNLVVLRSETRLLAQNEVGLECLEFPGLLPAGKGRLGLWVVDGVPEAQAGSSGVYGGWVIIAESGLVLFYLIRNFIVGNLDLPGDLFSQGVLFAGTVLGAGERRLRT